MPNNPFVFSKPNYNYKEHFQAICDATKSYTCPYRGCIVSWNDSKQLFVCPCHGSKFDITGKVVNGPATENLSC